MLANWLPAAFQQPTPNRTKDDLKSLSIEIPLDEISSATNHFAKENRISSGDTGEVYYGEREDGLPIAVKRIVHSKLDEDGWTQDTSIDEEIRVLSKIRHPNIVLLLGFHRNTEHTYLAYEWMAGGDVHHRLRDARTNKGPFGWSERVSVLHDTATGLSYLHCITPKIFHRDIKTPNILLDKSGGAKIADFGLAIRNSSLLKDKLHMTVKMTSGTPGYTDPEYLNTNKMTEASEVFSFGMVILEHLLNQPVARMDKEGALSYPINDLIQPELEDAVSRVMANLDPTAEFPASLARAAAELALRCVDEDVDARPSFVKVAVELKKLNPKAGPNRAMIGADYAAGHGKQAAKMIPRPVDQTILPADFQMQNGFIKRIQREMYRKFFEVQKVPDFRRVIFSNGVLPLMQTNNRSHKKLSLKTDRSDNRLTHTSF